MNAAGSRIRRLELAFVLAGTFCLGWTIGFWGHTQWYQWNAIRQFERALAAQPLASPSLAPAVAPIARGDSLIGVLGIPRLDLAIAVLEGDDPRTLDVAVGHLPDTDLPWTDGNTALAGHRDTFFRRLRHVSVGDDVHLDTRHGTFRYRVRRLSVVDADDVSVLTPEDGEAGLTLITCFPFDYVGPAPRRFVVQAKRIAAR